MILWIILLMPTIFALLELVLPWIWLAGKLCQFGITLTEYKKALPTFGTKGLAEGIIFGLLVCGGLFLCYHILPAGLIDGHMMKNQLTKLGITNLTQYVIFAGIWLVFNSLLEEYYWRWFVFDTLKKKTTPTTAGLLAGLGFAGGHLVLLASYFSLTNPLVWLMAVFICIGGFYWSWLYNRSGTLLASWISHCIVDCGIFAAAWDILRHAG